jgi:hypothetical protein
MLLGWMAYSVLFGALICAVALAVDRVAAMWSRAQRFVWVGALVAAVTIPLIMATRPRSAPSGGALEPVGAPLVTDTTIAVAFRAAAHRPVPERLDARVSRLIAASDQVVIGAWALASLSVLALLARASIGLRRRRAHWRQIEMDGLPVLVAPNVGPAVVGAIAPSVVIPQWSLSLDASVRALMLRHEVEHIRARDPLLLFGAVATTALAPWNPALWFIVRRLRVAVEIDCDQRVLRFSPQRREYGELLLTVGARLSASLPFTTSLAERRPSLERRIRAMTSIRPRHPGIVTAACVALVAVATTAAVRSPHPRSLVTRSAPPSAIALAPVITRAPGVIAPIVTNRGAVTPATPRSAKLPGAPAAAAGVTSAESAIVRRGPDSLTVEEIRAMIAAHHPSALAGDPAINTITLVVDARGAYVVSLAESRPFEVGGGRGARGRSGGGGVAAGGGGGVARGAEDSAWLSFMARGRAGGGALDSTIDAQMAAAMKALREKLAAAGGDPSQSIPIQKILTTTIRSDTIVFDVEARVNLASMRVLLARDSAKQVADTKLVGELLGLNMPALVQLVDPETIDAVKADIFKPGELGTTALRVFVVRQKP